MEFAPFATWINRFGKVIQEHMVKPCTGMLSTDARRVEARDIGLNPGFNHLARQSYGI